jgi:hypothetical protein
VRFRFAIEGYKFERLDTFDFCDQFMAALQLMQPTEASGLVFTSFQEVTTEFDEDHNNVERPSIDFRTIFTSTAAMWGGQEMTLTGIEINPTIE